MENEVIESRSIDAQIDDAFSDLHDANERIAVIVATHGRSSARYPPALRRRNDAKARLIGLIERRASHPAPASACGQWVPTHEREPEVDIRVIAYYASGRISFGYRTPRGRWRDAETFVHTEIPLAWQPLPEPYRNSNDGDDNAS